MNLREQVENELPNWQSWYPSLFDAAVDLGLIRPSSAIPPLLSPTATAACVPAAEAHRRQWQADENPPEE